MIENFVVPFGRESLSRGLFNNVYKWMELKAQRDQKLNQTP